MGEGDWWVGEKRGRGRNVLVLEVGGGGRVELRTGMYG